MCLFVVYCSAPQDTAYIVIVWFVVIHVLLLLLVKQLIDTDKGGNHINNVSKKGMHEGLSQNIL